MGQGRADTIDHTQGYKLLSCYQDQTNKRPNH
jgi:hypothetical protein